jgi:adenosylhomocysteine nucleosidase
VPAPEPVDVGVVAALPIEVGPLLRRFRDVRRYKGRRHTVIEGHCGGRLVAMVVAGPGRRAARRGAELLLAGHRPRWLVSAGFAGGLDPTLPRDAVLLPREVIDLEGGHFSIDVTVPPGSDGPTFGTGRLVTVDHVVLTSRDKAALRGRTGADAVDMETSAVAALCAERSIRFLALRVISDPAGIDLPPEVLSVLGATGSYRLGAAFGSILRRPSSLKDLLSLRDRAHTSATRLAEVLPAAIARLPC